MKDMNTVACIGAGLVGYGWATLFLSKGYTVILQDAGKDFLDTAISAIRTHLAAQKKNNFLTPGEIEQSLERIHLTTRIEDAVSAADYIQESVPDDIDIKRQVFQQIDAAAKDDAIIASSSSGLLMADIQTAAAHPGRCVLVHPFLPVHLIPLIEICGGPQTSPDTIKIARDFMQKLGKTPIVLKKEVPGYIVNRLQAAILREAMDLVDKGVATAEDIDTAFCKGAGLRDPFIGPFLRAHLAGNSVENFFKRYDQSYKDRLKTMGSWDAFPPSAVTAVIEDVNKMEMVANHSMDELKTWRDNKLISLLEITDTETRDI